MIDGLINDRCSKTAMESSTLNYKEYIVTFIDILGFKNLIEKRYKGNAAPIYGVIKEIGETNKVCSKLITTERLEKNLEYNAFSDSIVRRICIEGKQVEYIMQALSSEIYQLALLQAYLIEQGIFIRGCVNLGPLYARDRIFFGEAFNKAYKYETKVAVYPLIVLPYKLVKYILSHPQHRGDDILHLFGNPEMKHNHSHYYINYLYMMETMSLNYYEKPEDIAAFMAVHKRFIEHEIEQNEDDIKVLMKYLWLKEYHNHYVPRLAEATGRRDLFSKDNKIYP